MEPRNMEITELKDKVVEAILKLHNQALSDNEALELFATVAMVLDEQIAADQRRLVTDEATSATQVIRAAKSLSYSEVGAMTALFAALNSNEGILVASKVADAIGVTRSVIVNALSKLESAGMVRSRSLGIKGTWIKILRPEIVDVLKAAA